MRNVQWVFVVLYALLAVIAAWGGWLELNPPVPAKSPGVPEPLPLLVNGGMVAAAAFYFLTAAAFGLVAFLAARDAAQRRAAGLVTGLNNAFAAFLALISAYFLWYGGNLMMLGGSAYYLLAGLALLAVATMLLLRSRLAAWMYAAIVGETVIWSLFEAGLDFVALLPRLAAWIIVGLWFLSPWYRAAMAGRENTRDGAGGYFVLAVQSASVVLLALAAVPGYAVEDGTRNPQANSSPVSDWKHYGNGTGGQRFVELEQINTGNVSQLKEAWRFRTGVPYDNKNTPLMVGGFLYHCTAGNTLVAVNATTGKEVWRHDSRTKPGGGEDLDSAPISTARTCRGVGYHQAAPDDTSQCRTRILMGTTDARLVAVDAQTGRRCTEFGFDGAINLRSGLGPHDEVQYYVTSPPLIAGDIAVVGGWVFDTQRLGMPSGVLRAYNAVTGDFVWAWDMGNPGYYGLPDEGGEFTRGTPNVWSIMSYDPKLNLIYAPTGNSSPDYFDGDLRTEFAEKYSSSVVALDAASGVPRWSYQTVHRDIWDYDVPAQPVLVNVRKNGEGEPIPALAQPTKRGDIFLLDRRTGVPIYETPELPVPQGPEPGERVAATQPFSPLPDFRAELSEDDMWGLTPLDQLHCRIEFKKMRYEGHLTPPMRGGGGYGLAKDTWGGTLQYPGNIGGFNWGSVSVDADNGLLVAAPMKLGNRLALKSIEDRAQEAAQAADRRRVREPEDELHGAVPDNGRAPAVAGASGARFDQNRVLYRAQNSLFMSSWRLPIPFLRRQDGLGLLTELPCLEPPYGVIGVIDLNQNKLLWKRPFGSMKESGPFGIRSGLPLMVGTPIMAGSITTRGGLIFHGGAMDSTFRALDLRTGKVRWKADLPGSAHATPISYMGADGRQYVAITVPNPTWRFPRPTGPAALQPADDLGGYIIAYALPESGGDEN